MKVTKHAKKRIKRRCNVGADRSKKMARNVFEKGLSHAEAQGALKKYISFLFLKRKKANNIKIYDRKVWIFANETLITVFPIPVYLEEDAVVQCRNKKNLQNKKEEERV